MINMGSKKDYNSKICVIQIDRVTRDKLGKLKVYRLETYNDIIKRLIE